MYVSLIFLPGSVFETSTPAQSNEPESNTAVLHFMSSFARAVSLALVLFSRAGSPVGAAKWPFNPPKPTPKQQVCIECCRAATAAASSFCAVCCLLILFCLGVLREISTAADCCCRKLQRLRSPLIKARGGDRIRAWSAGCFAPGVSGADQKGGCCAQSDDLVGGSIALLAFACSLSCSSAYFDRLRVFSTCDSSSLVKHMIAFALCIHAARTAYLAWMITADLLMPAWFCHVAASLLSRRL